MKTNEKKDTKISSPKNDSSEDGKTYASSLSDKAPEFKPRNKMILSTNSKPFVKGENASDKNIDHIGLAYREDSQEDRYPRTSV